MGPLQRTRRWQTDHCGFLVNGTPTSSCATCYTFFQKFSFLGLEESISPWQTRINISQIWENVLNLMKMNWNFDLLIDYYSPEIISHISQYLTPISLKILHWTDEKLHLTRKNTSTNTEPRSSLYNFPKILSYLCPIRRRKRKKKDKRNSIQRTKARSIEFYVWIKLSKGVFQGPREIQSTRPPFWNVLYSWKLSARPFVSRPRVAATSTLEPCRGVGLKHHPKKILGSPVTPVWALERSPTLALSIGVANIYMPPPPPLVLAPFFWVSQPSFRPVFWRWRRMF